jgi:hypothetical protein
MSQPEDFPGQSAAREQRLVEIRREAEAGRELKAPGIRPSGAPFPLASPETGYYGLPLLKEPPWTWEIPLYFFAGGAAGAAAVVGAIADYTGADRQLVKDARWIAAAGCIVSPLLLVHDLGRPERFLNMLRVFKPQSTMSVGVWTLLGFSGGTAAALFAGALRDRYGPSLPLRILEHAGQAASLALGLPFSSYTGVLIGATAVPAWNQNVSHLPIHFSMSGLGAGVGLLEMMGHEKSRALQTLGIGAALFECWEGWRLESGRKPVNDPLRHGPSGRVTRVGGVLSGPVPASLRLLSLLSGSKRRARLRRWAAISAVAGSLLTRVGWIQAGHVSTRDWRRPLEIPNQTQSRLSS